MSYGSRQLLRLRRVRYVTLSDVVESGACYYGTIDFLEFALGIVVDFRCGADCTICGPWRGYDYAVLEGEDSTWADKSSDACAAEQIRAAHGSQISGRDLVRAVRGHETYADAVMHILLFAEARERREDRHLHRAALSAPAYRCAS